MRIITRRRLVEFWTIHPNAKGPMLAWESIVKGATWTCPNDVKQTFRNADWVRALWIFDVSRDRIVADVRYQRITEEGYVAEGIVYIRHVFTHPEYDAWSKKG